MRLLNVIQLIWVSAVTSSAVGSQISARHTSATILAQPPLPANRAISDSSIFTLSSSFEITKVPTTREYWWNISTAAASPDGFARQIFDVNNQFPGPLIEANTGDTVIVHVYNSLSTGQGIHWHGMTQNGSQWMDGVPGISQCSIPPGGSFTYNFTITEQYGTYWWHTHFANQLADGLIVHSPDDPLKRGIDFDEDRILYIQDWLHDQSDFVLDALHSPAGYRGVGAAPQGDTILINGIGQQNCSAPTARTGCHSPAPAEIVVPVNKRIRFRIINVGAHATMRVSIDQHPFEVIEADDTPIFGPTIHELAVGAGQRYSIVINTTQGGCGDGFWIRSSAAAGDIFRGFTQIGLAVLRYEDDSGPSQPKLPETLPWNDLAPVFEPRIVEDAPATALQAHVFSNQVGLFVDVHGVPYGGMGFNKIAYKNQINYPLLQQLQDGISPNSSLIASGVFDGIGGGDIIVNNLDAGITHPYHLHGRKFYLVGRGVGKIDVNDIQHLSLNTTNPLRRDVIHIPGGHWAILRLITDVAGVWPLHCHIGWHLSEGKLAAIVIQPEAIRKFEISSDWTGLCEGLDRDEFGPAKRSRSRR